MSADLLIRTRFTQVALKKSNLLMQRKHFGLSTVNKQEVQVCISHQQVQVLMLCSQTD